MAVVNQYKFFGLTAQDASSAGKKMFGTTIVPPVTGDTKPVSYTHLTLPTIYSV